MLLHNGAIKWEKKKKNVKWAETIPMVVFYQSPTSSDRPFPIQRLESIYRCINTPANPRPASNPLPSLPRIPPQIPPPLASTTRGAQNRGQAALLPLRLGTLPAPPTPPSPRPDLATVDQWWGLKNAAKGRAAPDPWPPGHGRSRIASMAAGSDFIDLGTSRR